MRKFKRLLHRVATIHHEKSLKVQLPDDIVFYVLQYLESEFILRVCLFISKQFLQQSLEIQKSLNFSDRDSFNEPSLISFVNCKYIQNLTILNLSSNKLRVEGARLISQCNALNRLTMLDVSNNGIEFEGANHLSHSEHLSNLTELNLAMNMIGVLGLRAIVNSPTMKRLRVLNINCNYIFGAGLKSVGSSENMNNLTDLNMSTNIIGNKGLLALKSECPYLCHLTRFNLTNCEIGNEGAKCLAQSIKDGVLTNLKKLFVGFNFIEKEGAQALQSCTHLSVLDFSGNNIEA
ncbi:hypothetical protein C9374_001136 [Naegleria lovaniensis]|uniref:Uncharacterized protein n=1 Tax=Naegleria lovaniensis TaxID=51637 RepID=A0AA88GV44_NAELO|nr:uncharacterized protein C9374_001136 [Naegleria lovaniensis]KAG2387542.1 hypothetical protein C9374_001136 [Naegleria lovaniensis]